MRERSFSRTAAAVAAALAATLASLPGAAAETQAKNGAGGPGATRPVPQWNQKMRKLAATLAEIVTDVSSDERFDDPATRKTLERDARRLSELAHDIDSKDIERPDKDPSVFILSGMFSDQAGRAYRELRRGHRAYARDLLRSISGYCISCHTRNGAGPSFAGLPLLPTARTLNAVERGEFFTATRQYDRALEEFRKAALDPAANDARERAVRYYLAIAVRVKSDPGIALSLIDDLLKLKATPFYLRVEATQWRDSLIQWQGELDRTASSEEGLHAEAVRLVAAAHTMQRYPQDHAADILYLRASATVHKLLQSHPDGRYTGDALLLAGLCYELLRPLNIGDMHETYYETCIRKVPHTPDAETCYRRLEESTYAGYSGSSGTLIPEDVQIRLKELESLAHPLPTVQR